MKRSDYVEVYDIKEFSYNETKRKFISEISTLGIAARMTWPYMFYIENKNTLNRALFTCDSTVKNIEDDVEYVVYKSTSSLGEFTAIIFND